jgi:hypothetical protein
MLVHSAFHAGRRRRMNPPTYQLEVTPPGVAGNIMRIRFFIVAILVFWIAAESRFSPAFFRVTVESSLASLEQTLTPQASRNGRMEITAAPAAPSWEPRPFNADLEPFRTVAVYDQR